MLQNIHVLLNQKQNRLYKHVINKLKNTLLECVAKHKMGYEISSKIYYKNMLQNIKHIYKLIITVNYKIDYKVIKMLKYYDTTTCLISNIAQLTDKFPFQLH